MGLASPETAKWAGEEEFDDFGVWPENWTALEVFLAMSTQWRWTGGMEPHRSGLDLTALPVVYEGLQVPRKRRAEIFQLLKVMEGAALEAMSSK